MMHEIYLRLFALTQVDINPLPKVAADKNTFTNLSNIFFATLGAICLLIVTIAGFRYITAHGDPQAVAKAKNTIIYALVGIAVSLFAVTIVNFVLGNL